MMNIKIKFEAVGTVNTVNDVCNNFYEYYPEFSCNMEKEDYKYSEETGEFMLLWVGNFEDDELNDDDMDALLRLTHHAEGFYEDTSAEYVHVEVCVNDEWHGKLK